MDDRSFAKYVLHHRLLLTDIYLNNCHNITDLGIETMSCLVQNLQRLHVQACPKVTPFSKTVIATNCKETIYTFQV